MKIIIARQTAGWGCVRGLRTRLRQLASVLDRHLQKVGFDSRQTSLALVLTDHADIRRLNHMFRGIDKATNVLSFPAYDPTMLRVLLAKNSPKKLKSAPLELGDIILGYQYIVNESRKNHKILCHHVMHMLVHGVLHLFGYTHETDKTARLMETLEIRILRDLGIKNPYRRRS